MRLVEFQPPTRQPFGGKRSQKSSREYKMEFLELGDLLLLIPLAGK